MAKATKEEVYDAIALSLVEFGYRDITGQMIREIHDAMIEGKVGADLPHGVIGKFAEKQIEDAHLRGLL